jgi:predicted lipoprotein with Yx(FWY)xxD motif
MPGTTSKAVENTCRPATAVDHAAVPANRSTGSGSNEHGPSTQRRVLMTRKSLIRSTGGLVLVPLLAAAGVPAARPGAGDRATAAATSRATLTVHETRYGKVLFDGHRRGLYLFDRDRTKKSTCYGSCAKAWPPFLTKSTPKAGAGIRKGLIGTTRRRNGTIQVTYGGHPLYYYEGDPKGQVKCQGVRNSGGLWLAVSPSGKAVPKGS